MARAAGKGSNYEWPVQTELAWAAGFFDGEGSTTPSGQRLAVALNIGQASDPAVLHRFRDAVGGLGKVRGPYYRANRAPMYYFQVGDFEGVQAVIAMIWPYLSMVKRYQASLALRSVRGAGKTRRREGRSMFRG